MPGHFGIKFVVNLFKIDRWAVPASANNINPLTLTLVVSAPGSQNTSFPVQLDNSVGANICGESGSDMIWALSAEVPDHKVPSVTFSVEAPDKGIFVR